MKNQNNLSKIELAINQLNLASDKILTNRSATLGHVDKAKSILMELQNDMAKTHFKLPRGARMAVVFLVVFLNLFFTSLSFGGRESPIVDGFGKTRHEAIQDGQVRSRQIGQIYILREVRQVGDSTYRATFTVRRLRVER